MAEAELELSMAIASADLRVRKDRGCTCGPGGARAAVAAIAATLLAAPALAQAPAPFPLAAGFARDLPVVAEHGMVASQEARASLVGVEVLKRGGNAVDAAVATGFALAVTLPRAGSLGGGGFMLLHLAASQQTIAIDYRETAPLDTPPDVFLDAKGDFAPALSQLGPRGIGVPGIVAGLALAHGKYGSGKFTLAQLIAPALRFARDGMAVDESTARIAAGDLARLGRFPSTRRIFLREDGSFYRRGEKLVQADLAATLEAIAQGGPQAFYQGPVALKIVEAVQGFGGKMTLDDMAAYQAVERVPVIGSYRGHTIASMPPPSSGGAHVVQILNLLEGFPLAELGQNSAATLHLMAESMKLAFADRSKYLGDPDFTHVPVAGLTSKAYADELRAKIDPARARPSKEIAPGNPIPYESDQTMHVSVIDGAGNGVSMTETLNFFWGVGLVAEGTGVVLNNELDDFAAKPDAPNAFGLLGGAANAPGPRKRPLSSMSPTLVFKDGELELATGSPGGSRIISVVVQIIVDAIDFNLNAAESVQSPRIHHQWLPDALRVERGLSPDTIALLKARGHNLVNSETLGTAITIFRSKDGLSGASDNRQPDHLAVGF